MRCPFCKSILENGYCKTCERQIHELYHHPNLEKKIAERKEQEKRNQEQNNEDVIEPEIVDDGDTNYQNASNGRQSGRQFSFRQSPLFTQYTMHSAGMNDSCLTGIITLALIFFVFLQMGFLAALGFAFFTFIGKVLSVIITLKSILNGKIIPPLMLDIAIWIISYCLVTWLA